MAQEITAQAGLSLKNNFAYFSQPVVTIRADQTGTRQYSNTQNVGFAADESLMLPTWANLLGWAFFRNLDPTNFIQVGINVAATFYPLIRLKPGEPGSIRLAPNVTLYAQADTAAVDLYYTILEE